ncbi:MAG: MFS transporter [Actinomycetales bacterium]|nr:MFS transporter [Actinomycetales bacterium]
MSHDPLVLAHPALRRAERAVFLIFALNGFHFANFAARVPSVRDGLGMTPQQMGLLLLVGSMGSLIALPLSGLIVQRLGAASTVRTFAVINVAGLVLAAAMVQAGMPVLVAASMFVFCVGTSVWDSAMNLEGTVVERRRGVTILPRLHAGFSLGTVTGAGTGALAAWAELPLVTHFLIVLVPSLVAVLLATRAFLPHETVADAAQKPARRENAGRAARAWGEPRTLLLGLVVLAAAITEGAANDWMALAVVDGFDVSNATGAVFFGVFVAAMTVGRLLGGAVLDRFGRVVVLRASATLAIVGLLFFALPASLALTAVGAVLWGLGAAVGFPVGISAAADDPAHAAMRVPVVATIGYSAFLVGPPVLGFLADAVGYRTAMLAIAVPAVISLLVAGIARPVATSAQGGDAEQGADGGQSADEPAAPTSLEA